MALIACPDCKRQVSSLAVACPQCARPIASDPAIAAPKVEQRVEDPPTASLDPGALARQYRERVTARVEGVTKTCTRCGKDVTEDIFRAKSPRGYMCGDCQDAEMEKRMVAQERLRRLTLGALIVFVLGALVFGAMIGTTFLGKTTPKK